MIPSREITIINVPSDVGSMIKGKHLAPDAFRGTGFSGKLQALGYDVKEVNALQSGPQIWNSDSTFGPNGVRNEERNVEVNYQVKRAVRDASGQGYVLPFQIVVGGECNMVPAIMSGLWHRLAPKRVGLMYVDGDCDLTLPSDPASSGNLASMTFTHLTLRDGALDSMRPFSRPDGSGVCDAKNSVIFGLNMALQGNTWDQLGYLFDEGFRVITSASVAKNPSERAKQSLEWLEDRVDYILVHLDVDAIDATAFPLANIPNRTGADFDKIMTAMKVFLSSKKVCALSIAEVNPDHDPGLKMTNRLANALADAFRTRMTGL